MTVPQILLTFIPDLAVFVSALFVNMFMCILWRRRVVLKREYEKQFDPSITPTDSMSLPTIDTPPQAQSDESSQLYYQTTAFESIQPTTGNNGGTNSNETNKQVVDTKEQTVLDYDAMYGIFSSSISSQLPHIFLFKLYWMTILMMGVASIYPSFVSAPFFLLIIVLFTLYASSITIKSPHYSM